MATLNGTIFKIDGTAPNPWHTLPRGCPQPGPVAIAPSANFNPRFAKAHIYFQPCQTPFLDTNDETSDGEAVIVTSEIRAEIDDQTGEFSVTLLAGNYKCTVGADEFLINIPSDSGTFELQNVITDGVNLLPPASNANQGTFPSTAEDFVLPANAVGVTGAPVATGWTQTVYGPGKFVVTAVVSIQATSRGNGAEDNEIYTAFLQDTTNNVQIGLEVCVQNIFTGATGQIILTGTVNIAGDSNVLLEVYAAGNPNTSDQTAAPDSVGTVIMGQCQINIQRLP